MRGNRFVLQGLGRGESSRYGDMNLREWIQVRLGPCRPYLSRCCSLRPHPLVSPVEERFMDAPRRRSKLVIVDLAIIGKSQVVEEINMECLRYRA